LAPKEPRPEEVVERWAQLGLDKKEVAKKLFEKEYGGEHKEPPAKVVGLYAGVPRPEYERFKSVSDERLAQEMMASTNSKVSEFAKQCKGDLKCLRAAVEYLIWADK
jgi:hypothetical protein